MSSFNLTVASILRYIYGNSLVSSFVMGLFYVMCESMDKRYLSALLEGIETRGFPSLIRRLEPSNEAALKSLLHDPKLIANDSHSRLTHRLYVPASDVDGIDELTKSGFTLTPDSADEKCGVNVHILETSDVHPSLPAFLRMKAGMLCLHLNMPFAVPGGRFNEMYGWDSYFLIRGLRLSDIQEHREAAAGTAKQLMYQVKHYGKILNANRSYYLNRSQPPFTSSALLAVNLFDDPSNRSLVTQEYQEVWMCGGRYDVGGCGLNVYAGHPVALCRAVQSGGYDRLFDMAVLGRLFSGESIEDPEISRLVKNDLAMRESGHDSSRRFVEGGSVLVPACLNCLLFKTEMDLGLIDAAERRRERMNALMWDEKLGFADYRIDTGKKYEFMSPANLVFPLWAKLASPTQALTLRNLLVAHLECAGGVAGCREGDSVSREYQWDYPWGWAPHQILAWEGLKNYGFNSDAQRLCYKWVLSVARVHSWAGCVPEKLDVVLCNFGEEESTESTGDRCDTKKERKTVEYGNQCVKEGEYFGWTSASVLVAVKEVLSRDQLESLERLVPWKDVEF